MIYIACVFEPLVSVGLADGQAPGRSRWCVGWRRPLPIMLPA